MVVKFFNHIRVTATNSKLFKVLCHEVGTQFDTQLTRREKKKKSMNSIFEVNEEIAMVFENQRTQKERNIKDENICRNSSQSC